MYHWALHIYILCTYRTSQSQFLSLCSIVVKRHHDQGNSCKKKCGLVYSLRGLVYYHCGGEHDDTQVDMVWRSSWEFYIFIHRQRESKKGGKERRVKGGKDGGRMEWRRERERERYWHGFLKSKSPHPSDILPLTRAHLLHLLILSQSSTPWWLSIQIFKPMGHFYSDHYIEIKLFIKVALLLNMQTFLLLYPKQCTVPTIYKSNVWTYGRMICKL